MKKLIYLLVLLLAACGPTVPAAQTDAPFPTPGPLSSTAHVYPVETGWLNGQTVRYYNLGANSPLDPANPSHILLDGVWVFVTSVNADGSPVRLEGQNNILDFAPGDPAYSDLWQAYFIIPPAGYAPNSLTSLKALNASGMKIAKQPMTVNCPFVPDGSSLKNSDLKLQQGWVGDKSYSYYDFGPTNPTPGKLYAFVTGFNADGTPKLVAGQHFIFDSQRGDKTYSDFRLVQWVLVDGSYVADSIKSVKENDCGELPAKVKSNPQISR